MKKRKMMWIAFIFAICTFSTTVFAHTATRSAYEKTGHVIWEVKTKEKLVAITFDDGPHPIFTPQILDILAKYNAKATFFVAGNKVIRFPEVLKRQVKEGHEIANHTYNHIYNRNITEATLTAELEQTDELIQKTIGIKPTLYRPVGGLYNDLIINTAVKNGKLVILWSWKMDPKDWRNTAASQISSIITSDVQQGNIILLHDWHGTEDSRVSQTVKSLESIMKYLDDNGYKCVTVSELLYHSSKRMPEILEPAL